MPKAVISLNNAEELEKFASQNDLLSTFLEYKISNSIAWFDFELDNPDYFDNHDEIENSIFLNKFSKDEIEDASTDLIRLKKYSDSVGISTCDELIELGDAGMFFDCSNPYEHIYNTAKAVFKNQYFCEAFASSTLYFFWQRIVLGTGRLQIETTSKRNGVIITERVAV